MARIQDPTPTQASQPMRFGRPPDKANVRLRKLIIFGVILLIALALPPVGSVVFPMFGPTLYSDIIIPVDQTLVYVLLALGLNVVVGYAGLLDLGYAAFFAIGAYTMGFLTSSQTPWYNSFHLSFWLALPISFIVAGIFGVLLGAPTLRLRGDYLAIVTLGFGEIVPNVFRNLNKVTNGDTGLAGINSPFNEQGTSWTWWYYITLIVIVVSIFLILRLVNSRVGRAWMAMREDEIAAAAMGINLVTTKLIAFGTGASFAGFAGGIYASALGTANPSQFLFAVSILVLSMVILGGMGNIWGVIFGAVLLELSDRSFIPFITDSIRNLDKAGTNEFIQNVSSGSRLLIFGLILVVMMLVRPAGLFPSGRRKMELKVEDSSDLQPFIARSENPIEGMDDFQSINYNPSVTKSSGTSGNDKK